MDLNNVQVIGRLASDPEGGVSQSGTPWSRFDIATHGIGADRKEVAHFIPVVVWGKQASAVNEHKRQGDQVCISGRLHQNKWVDKETGTNRSRLEVWAGSVQFLAMKNGEARTARADTPPPPDDAPPTQAAQGPVDDPGPVEPPANDGPPPPSADPKDDLPFD